MVDEQEINPVHQLYMDLSGRYKAGWTFHRFIQGLRKFFGSQELEDHTSEFQELYQSLRETSRQLNDPNIQPVIARLETIRRGLDGLIQLLDEEDRRVTPSLVRLFFQRVKSYDERILLDLIRFYLEVQRGRSWDEERIDKVDFLLSRLGESIVGEDISRDKTRLVRVLESIALRRPTGAEVDPQKLANRQKMIRAVRSEIEQLNSFEALTERDLIGHYRNVKHGLGNLLFDKSILPIVVDTNLLLAARIQELTRIEERRILEDYERVAQLEEQGSVDQQLGASVNRLHEQVSRFRKHIASQNIRIGDITALRGSLLEILGRLEECAPEKPEGEPEGKPEAAPVASASLRVTAAEAIPVAEDRDLFGRAFTELISALSDDREAGAEDRNVGSSLVAYRLEPRELKAFDRLMGAARCNERLERFLLATAALRFRINEEVGEIHAYRGRAGESQSSLSQSTRQLLAVGDWYIRQFEHFAEFGDEAGGEEGREELRLLRMRLLRDYSGLWLVANS